ncbi:MAG: hypothetical protein KIT31_11595 [Deltaproteobacteria bacterium]|nr:hypothetical protein [Deltaproteobacteria bacterium]
MKTSRWIASLFASLAVTACAAGPDDGEGTVCEDGKCDGLPFADQLQGREDPIAKFLRGLHESGVIDDKGVYHAAKAGSVAPAGDPLFYQKLVTGLTTEQGCRENSLVTYTLTDDLIGDTIFPRIIATVCADNELVANQFIATLGGETEDGDVALDELEFFAWDNTLQRYSFYKTELGARDGQLKVAVSPAECTKCHLDAHDTNAAAMPMLPIMNELTKPWTHWNAGPGGNSESFQVPDSLRGKKNWTKYGENAVGAASRFEKVIRDANATRITPARSKTLFRPAKLDEAMGLIRPVFCDEQVNYVSELATGEITTDAFVSPGLKAAYRGIQSTWPWAWFNNDTVTLPAVADDQRLFVIPVRGVADVTFEAQLYSILTPNAILAVRALDWKKPMGSTFRCNLWKDAFAAFADKPPALTGRNRDAVKVLFDEIMKHGGMSTRSLADGKVIAIADADTDGEALKAAVAAGTVPSSCGKFCEVTLDAYGTMLDSYLRGLSAPAKRAELLAERDRRICAVVKEVEPAAGHTDHGPQSLYPNKPSFIRIDGAGKVVDTVPASCRE